MDPSVSSPGIWVAAFVLLHGSVIVRALVARNREPTSRAAWVLILVFLPAVGIAAYLLFGEPWVARRLRSKGGNALRALHEPETLRTHRALHRVPAPLRPAFRACRSVDGGHVTGGNLAEVARDSDAAIERMVADIDNAHTSVHLSFYIWLTDGNGLKVVQALLRARERGITCRVVADGVGSSELVRSRHWNAMGRAGVHLCTSMKLSFGLSMLLGNRIDLRNHRKIVVIDHDVTWCGSQNCADAAFRVKPRYAPWVDIMLRFRGPVAVQNQYLFARQWMLETGEDLNASIAAVDAVAVADGFPAIAFATGPLSPRRAMSDVFTSLLHCADHEVVISTPYFVPDAPLLAALVCCARRHVRTRLILPARNDSWIVSIISKAYYPQLLSAGVEIYEFTPGLLHAKTMVVDGQAVLTGSANMDRRSLELNFENNILACSATLAADVRKRQHEWIAQSRPVDQRLGSRRRLPRRLGENIVTMFGPLF